MLSLSEFRSRVRGLPDILNYAAYVADGVVQNKDGSLTAGWYYRGEDLASSSAAELEAVSARLNAALMHFGSGWMINVDAMRVPTSGYPARGAFPDPTTHIVDEERRQQHGRDGGHYESIYALTLTYLPPSVAERRMEAFVYSASETGRGQATSSPADHALEALRRGMQSFEDAISSVLRLRRMRDVRISDGAMQSDLLRYLQFCVTGLDHPMNLPPVPMYLDAVLGGQDFYCGLRPRVGGMHLRPIAIMGFPAESHPGMLDQLNNLPITYRWSNRYIFLEPTQARAVLNRYRRKWKQKIRGFKDQIFQTATGAVDAAALDMANDAESAMSEAGAGVVRYGYYTSAVILMDRDVERVDESARTVVQFFNNAGFVARIEDVNAVEAYLGSLPGHAFPNVRRPPLHTLNLADILPTTAVWPGLDAHPCPYYPAGSPPLLFAATGGATPFRLSLHVGDVGHTAILGPTGAGKSTLLGLTVAQHFRYPDAQVFAFDKGYSIYVLTKAAGGDYYDIGGESSQLAFCPLANVHESHAERAWAEEWLETLVILQGVAVTPAQRQSLHRAVVLLSASTGRTMTDLMNTLQDHALREALAHYTLAGGAGHLLDAESDGLGEGIFQVFEMEHLMAMGEKNVVPVLLYLFHRIEKRLRGQPTLIPLDEVWLMLRHALFREKLREWLKVLRKKNAAVVFATNSLSDVIGSPIRDVILESCLTKIFLPNAEACTEQVTPLYESFGLNARQIDIVATASPKRHYYYTSTLGRRLIDLGLGPVALSFVGVGGSEDVAKAKALSERHGSQWPAEWLRLRGLADWAAYWERQSPVSRSERSVP